MITQSEFEELRASRPFVTTLLCWIIGHAKDGCLVEDSFINSSGEPRPGWKYYCSRCNTKGEFPDQRSVLFRFKVWLSIKYRKCKLVN